MLDRPELPVSMPQQIENEQCRRNDGRNEYQGTVEDCSVHVFHIQTPVPAGPVSLIGICRFLPLPLPCKLGPLSRMA
jgi:hypothetical protein